jgi:sugar phosphate isomerase/epimerase
MYKPKHMKIAVLTAALQDIVPREKQRSDPLASAQQAALWWIHQAKELGVHLQLSAALHLPDGHVPPEAMLDPVAAHLPARTMSATEGVDLSDESASTLIAACGKQVKICDIGYFDDLLHKDVNIRAKIHAHLLRCGRAAVKLKAVGCEGVTTFIGRHSALDMDQNVKLFEEEVIPILKKFKEMGAKLLIEQCPMPGWNTTDLFINNIGYCAGMWIKLLRIAEKHDVADALFYTYDESHDILMGNTHQGSFAAMRAAGLHGHVNRFHGKQQYRNRALTALWTVLGQQIDLGCRIDGQPHPDAAKQSGAWGKMTCAHGMIGVGHYNLDNMSKEREADWFDHQLMARDDVDGLGLDASETYFILEHEWGANRVQDRERVLFMIALSVAYIRGIDAAADSMFQSRAWAKSLGLTLPGVPTIYKIPDLKELADKIVA